MLFRSFLEQIPFQKEAETIWQLPRLKMYIYMRPIMRKCAFRSCADSEGPDQTARMRSLIRAFTVR